MVDCSTTLGKLYKNIRLSKTLEIERFSIPPDLLRNALQDNYKHLVGLPQNTRVRISTEYAPDINPRCFLGFIVYTGFNDFDPELLPSWMYICKTIVK